MSTISRSAIAAFPASPAASAPALAAVGAALFLVASVGAFACDLQSGPHTAALVELYTSEGCSSCPPADRALGRLQASLPSGAEAVPLALHVDYWDAIGWKDPFAQPAFRDRQHWLVEQNRHTTVYTPHFFVGGRELSEGAGGLDAAIRNANAAPAAASIHLQSAPAANGGLNVRVDAGSTHKSAKPSSLFVALTESGLASRPTRGENGGATLGHDHVVRRWIGPIAMADGAAHWQGELPVDPSWHKDRLQVAAFVQTDDGTTLQALDSASCARLD